MFGSRLVNHFGASVPDAWRRAIANLKDFQLTRGLDRIVRQGHATPPTLPQFVKACTVSDVDDELPIGTTELRLPAPEHMDPIFAHGQKCLFAYLANRGAACDASLQLMIVAKNKLVNDFHQIATDDTVTGSEIRDAMFKAWDKLWKPMGAADALAHLESFRATGHASDAPRAMQRAAA